MVDVVEEVLETTLSGLMAVKPLLGSWSSYMTLVTLYGLLQVMEPMNMSLA